MKIVKVIDSINGQIKVYEDDTYTLTKKFKHYRSLVNSKEDLYYDLVDAGFVISLVELQISSSKEDIFFILNIKMTFYK
tara:strand:+ start:3250 stop:3486 length:237 start_codon:yes stop_codon:yes gene_type:complete